MFLQHFKRPWHKRKLSEPIKSYIWKAELQARGQLHYHLTTNSFLHFAEIRRVWNDLQKSRGWLDEYHQKTGHWDANSTDVHSVYRIKDVGRYLGKYIAKQEFRQSAANPEAGFPSLLVPVRLDAKVWGCSDDLKGKKRHSFHLRGETWDNLVNAVGNGAKHRRVEHCDFIDLQEPSNILSPTDLTQYENWKRV